MMIEKINPRVKAIKAYVAGATKDEVARRHDLDPAQIIKLASNENPFGPSPKAVEAIRKYAGQVNLYPEDYPRELITSISEYICVSDSKIIMGGNGADEVMDTMIKLLIMPGDEVVIHTPTFPYYELLTTLYGGRTVKVAMPDDFSFPIDSLVESIGEKTRLVIICSPNNPTGTVISESGLRRILDSGVTVMLDEAYIEFADRSYTGLVSEYENLVVLRTFSKAFGLAGLRVGYGVASEEIIGQAMKIKPPHNVNLLAQKAASAALKDLDYLHFVVEKTKRLREELFNKINGLDGAEAYRSQGNFLLVKLFEKDAGQIVSRLEKKGIIVRSCTGFGLARHIRVTVGREEENQAFMKFFKDVLG